MTLTPEAQKIREQYEAIGIHCRWHANGTVDLEPRDIATMAVWTHGQVLDLVEKFATAIIEDRKRIAELEDDVHDLKGAVYMGESPGV